jgi:hypothetical protein
MAIEVSASCCGVNLARFIAGGVGGPHWALSFPQAGPFFGKLDSF